MRYQTKRSSGAGAETMKFVGAQAMKMYREVASKRRHSTRHDEVEVALLEIELKTRRVGLAISVLLAVVTAICALVLAAAAAICALRGVYWPIPTCAGLAAGGLPALTREALSPRRR
jgi:hypothetical protein